MTPYRYNLVVALEGRTVEVKPTRNGDEWTPELLYNAIGRMVMSSGIDAITVFRDGKPYRHVNVIISGASTIPQVARSMQP